MGICSSWYKSDFRNAYNRSSAVSPVGVFVHMIMETVAVSVLDMSATATKNPSEKTAPTVNIVPSDIRNSTITSVSSEVAVAIVSLSTYFNAFTRTCNVSSSLYAADRLMSSQLYFFTTNRRRYRISDPPFGHGGDWPDFKQGVSSNIQS